MTAVSNFPPAPVFQQGPPARAAAPAVRALRVARGSLLLTTGTASHRARPAIKRLTSPPPSNGAVSARATLVAIDRNRWSRSSVCPLPPPFSRRVAEPLDTNAAG